MPGQGPFLSSYGKVFKASNKSMSKNRHSKKCIFIFIIALIVSCSYRDKAPGYLHKIAQGDYPAALAEVKPLAKQGDPYAQYILGSMYVKGRGVPQNYTKAVQWYILAAEKDYAPAQLILFTMYTEGLGTEKNPATAINWLMRSAKNGSAEAQNELAILYTKGTGLQRDYSQAYKWFKEAAGQGLSVAQSNLGCVYKNGLGVKQDYQKAVKCFRKAAEQGDSGGQNNLGLMYAEGNGISKNSVLACMWFMLAADKGGPVSRKYLEDIKMKMSSAQINNAETLAKKWKAKRVNH